MNAHPRSYEPWPLGMTWSPLVLTFARHDVACIPSIRGFYASTRVLGLAWVLVAHACCAVASLMTQHPMVAGSMRPEWPPSRSVHPGRHGPQIPDGHVHTRPTVVTPCTFRIRGRVTHGVLYCAHVAPVVRALLRTCCAPLPMLWLGEVGGSRQIQGARKPFGAERVRQQYMLPLGPRSISTHCVLMICSLANSRASAGVRPPPSPRWRGWVTCSSRCFARSPL